MAMYASVAICRTSVQRRLMHVSSSNFSRDAYKFVICGGGTGGLAVASSLARRFGENQVAVIEPSDVHYYQPMWTMVGGGIKTLEQSRRSMSSVMPKRVTWIKKSASGFEPNNNQVVLEDGQIIEYDFLVTALGLRVNFDQIKGLPEALAIPGSGVASNYSADTVTKTYECLKEFKGGDALFTFPTMPIKCPGAPQKIMYLADEYFRRNGVRDKTQITFNSAIGVIFGVKKYADRLLKVIEQKNIIVNFQHKLIEVIPDKKEAVFQLLAEGKEGQTATFKYDFLHATPPMGPLKVLRTSPLVDDLGWVDVNPKTMQHKKYSNVFGIGDCTNVPTSKTAAACAAESRTLKKNLFRIMRGELPIEEYDGYTSCPLVTGYDKCILAEFDFNAQPLETFPFDQGKERYSMYLLKADILPDVYWNGLLKGLWGGPATFRKILHLGF